MIFILYCIVTLKIQYRPALGATINYVDEILTKSEKNLTCKRMHSVLVILISQQ